MKYLYFLLISCSLFSACNSSDEKSDKDTIALIQPISGKGEKAIVSLESIKHEKILLDTAIVKGTIEPQIWEKYTDKAELKPFTEGANPTEEQLEKLEITFNIFKNKNNKIVAITEYPFSQSGDGFIAKTHYFTEDEKTFAYERHTSFFNSGCADVAYETITYFYKPDFSIADSTYSLTDQDNNQLKKQDCQMLYDEPIKVEPDLKTYLTSINYQQQ